MVHNKHQFHPFHINTWIITIVIPAFIAVRTRNTGNAGGILFVVLQKARKMEVNWISWWCLRIIIQHVTHSANIRSRCIPGNSSCQLRAPGDVLPLWSEQHFRHLSKQGPSSGSESQSSLSKIKHVLSRLGFPSSTSVKGCASSALKTKTNHHPIIFHLSLQHLARSSVIQ